MNAETDPVTPVTPESAYMDRGGGCVGMGWDAPAHCADGAAMTPVTPEAEPRTLWTIVSKFTPAGAALADGHYSRRTIGSPQFMPPGQTLVLLAQGDRAVFGWWRPHPLSGLRAMNGLDGWTCTIFRNDGSGIRSSDLILAAERELADTYDCGPDGMLTYVWDRKVASPNPGYCFKMAGWKAIGRSADGRKTLLWKDFTLAGIAP